MSVCLKQLVPNENIGFGGETRERNMDTTSPPVDLVNLLAAPYLLPSSYGGKLSFIWSLIRLMSLILTLSLALFSPPTPEGNI